MPVTTPDSQALRARAAGLRRLAGSLAASLVVDLHQRAGDDVWLGPTAFECRSDLIVLGRRLTETADDLVSRARVLEQRAHVLEVMAPVG